MMYTLHAFIPNITMSILAAGFVVWGFLGEGGGLLLPVRFLFAGFFNNMNCAS